MNKRRERRWKREKWMREGREGRERKGKKVNLLCIITMYHKLNTSKIEMDDVKQFVHSATDNIGREDERERERERRKRRERVRERMNFGSFCQFFQTNFTDLF